MNSINEFYTKKQRKNKIMEELNKSGQITIKKDFSDKFKVTERTIRRDMNEILLEYEYIVAKRGRNGGYKILKRGEKNENEN